MKALVINCGRNGLGIIRALGSKNVDVIAVDHNNLIPAIHSKYVKRKYIVTNMIKDEKKFIDEIITIGIKESKQDKIFLLPMNDEYVLIFTKYWEKLNDWFYAVFETDMTILLKCMEKTKMYKIAEEANVPYPRTLYSPINFNDIFKLSFPLVVKPQNRRSLESIKNNVFRLRLCHNIESLESAIQFLENINSQYIVQEFIPGSDDQLYTDGIFAYKGKLVASFTGRKLRQFPVTMGECSYGEVIREPRIVNYAEKIVNYTSYTGIAQIEFKKYNNEYYLMEMNPRSWSWNSLAEYSGINLPWIGCETIKTGEIKKYYQQKYEGKWNFFPEDLIHNVIKNHNISFCRALIQALKSECHAFWHRKDPLPAFFLILNRQKSRLSKLHRFIFKKIKK